MNILSKLVKKYKNIPPPVKASFWFMAMSIIQKGIQFLVTPIYTRILTTDEYGYYSVFMSWTGIVTIFATLTLNGGCFNNGMLKYETDQRRYISSMQGLGNAATIVVFSIIFIFIKPITKFTGMPVLLIFGMFILLMFNPAFLYWTSYQRYNYSYRMLVISTLAAALATPIIGVYLAMHISNRKYAVITAYLIVNTIVGVIFYIVNLVKGKGLYNKKYWLFALKFNVPLIPHYLSSIVLGQADRIMIERMVGESEAGIYSLSYSVSMMLGIVITALNSSYVPWTYKKMKSKEYQVIGTYSNYILIILGVFMMSGCLIAPELIRFLGTKEYMEAKWIIAPVMMGSYFTMLYSLFANIEFYFEKNIAIMIASVIAAIANIILNLIFIHFYGYIAAGYTTMACYMLLSIMHYFSMKRTLRDEKISNPYNMRFILIFSCGLTILSLLIMILYQTIIIRYCVVVGICIISFAFRKKIFAIFRTMKK